MCASAAIANASASWYCSPAVGHSSRLNAPFSVLTVTDSIAMPHGKGDGPPLIRPQQDSYGESLRIWWRCLLVHASRQLTDCFDQHSVLQLRCVPPRLPVGARPEPLQKRPAPQRVPLCQLQGTDVSGAQLDYVTTRYRGSTVCPCWCRRCHVALLDRDAGVKQERPQTPRHL